MADYSIAVSLQSDQTPGDVVRLAALVAQLVDTADADVSLQEVVVSRWRADDDGYEQDIVPLDRTGLTVDEG